MRTDLKGVRKMKIHNPWRDSHRKGADYARDEVRRENSQLRESSLNPTNPEVLQGKPTYSVQTGFHVLDVRHLGFKLMKGGNTT